MWNKIIPIGIMILIAFGLLQSKFDKRTKNTNENVSKKNTIPTAIAPITIKPQSIEFANATVEFTKALRQSVKQVAANDPYSEQLANLFDDLSIGSRLELGGSVISNEIKKRTSNLPLLPVIMVQNTDIPLLGSEPEATFSFTNTGIFIYYNIGEKWSTWYKSIVVLHELVHWDDLIISKREKPTGKGRDTEYYKGEIRAYEVEMRALNRASHNRMIPLLQEWIKEGKHQKNTANKWNKLDDGGTIEILSLFDNPLCSNEEFGNFLPSIQLMFILLQAQTEQEKIQWTQEYFKSTHVNDLSNFLQTWFDKQEPTRTKLCN